jgi:hypothetical protein
VKHIRTIFGDVQKLVVTNSPAILTGLGIAGTFVTAGLVGKASFRAADLISKEEEKHQIKLDTKDKVKLVWLMYLPSAGMVAVTVGSIFFAQRINTKRIAALATAYAMSDRAYSEYKDKVEEHFGKNKEKKVREDIAQDRTKTGNGGPIYLASDGGKHLCYEQYMGHYTKSSMEGLKSLRNEMNDTMLRTDYVSLSDWYGQLGIPTTTASDNLGWRSDGGLIELDITTTISDGDEPCLAFQFRPEPYPNFSKSH